MSREAVTLFERRADDIHIDIEAYFDGRKIVIDGYDIGESVKAYWGDSDYEYITTISEAGAEFLYAHFGITEGDQKAMLRELAKRFHSEHCYSEIRSFLDAHEIAYESFSWV